MAAFVGQHAGVFGLGAGFVVLPVPLAVVLQFGVFEQGHLDGRLVREFAHPEADLADGGLSVPDFGEHAAGFVQDDGGDVRGAGEGGLFLLHREVLVLDEHGHGGGAEVVPADAVRHDAGHMEQRPVKILGVCVVLGKGALGAVAFGFGHLCLYRGVVPAVGVLVQLDGEFSAYKARQRAHPQLRQLADGVDSVGRQAFFRLFPHPQEVPHAQGPHLFLHLFFPEGVDLIRFLEVGGHLGQQFVGADSYIYREAQGVPHLVFQPGGHLHRVVPLAAEAHVYKALIDTELLQDGGVASANANEPFRALLVPHPVSADDHQ